MSLINLGLIIILINLNTSQYTMIKPIMNLFDVFNHNANKYIIMKNQ